VDVLTVVVNAGVSVAEVNLKFIWDVVTRIKIGQKGKAYVDDQTAEQIRLSRGTLTSPGKESPYRNRSVEENLDLFRRMRAGEFKEGEHVLRARIDMAAPNINMRDPTIYRIRHKAHHRTDNKWCIYPMYDYTHCISDALEGITHSLCTLEFEDHRPLYDWLIENLPVPSRPRQYEFARLNLTYTVLSKRVLGRLVSEGSVRGWDDPRMPTVSALRRRGFPPEGVRNFLDVVGVGGKGHSAAEIEMLEHEVRDVLNRTAPRRFAVLRPLRLVIENYRQGVMDRFGLGYEHLKAVRPDLIMVSLGSQGSSGPEASYTGSSVLGVGVPQGFAAL
jgi:glutaminyl-tRNA synthetase